MIWTLKICLWAGFCDDISWEAIIEIEPSSSLEDLHFAIQQFAEFDNDHLYEFYTSRNERCRKRVCYSHDNGLVNDTSLEDLYPLNKGDSLFYLFDYGDSWVFKISRSRKKPSEAIPNVKYPKLIEESGNKPIQYSYPED